MGFQRFDPEAPRVEKPRLTIYGHLSGYLNAEADYQWFQDYDEVVFHVDPDRHLFAIEPAESGEGDYALSRDGEGHGADLSTRYPLVEQLDFDDDTLDESAFVELEWDDGHGWAVADLSGSAEEGAAGGDERPREKAEDQQNASGNGPKYCGTCGHRFASARGVSIHHSKADDHEGEPVIREEEPEEPLLADDDSSDDGDEAAGERGTTAEESDTDESADPTLDEVRAMADDVESVQELAEELDTTPGQARRLAMDADVYSDLHDKVHRPGVSG